PTMKQRNQTSDDPALAFCRLCGEGRLFEAEAWLKPGMAADHPPRPITLPTALQGKRSCGHPRRTKPVFAVSPCLYSEGVFHIHGHTDRHACFQRDVRPIV